MASKQTNLFGKNVNNNAENGINIEKATPTSLRGTYDKLKSYNGKIYTGMQVGAIHKWNYSNGLWKEQKLTPDKWRINYSCVKERIRPAPEGSGSSIGSGYHWYIIADQKAIKMDANRYQTIIDGIKFKVGHKRPNWNSWSYQYDHNPGYKQVVIKYLEKILADLKLSQ